MKKYLLIPNLLVFCLLLIPVGIYAQDVVADKKPKTEIRYALSGTLTVYERPDTNSKVIGQLIFNETLQVVVGSDQVEKGTSWIQIIYPYEGFYQQSEPPEAVKEEEIAVINRDEPNEVADQEMKAEEEAPSQMSEKMAEDKAEEEKAAVDDEETEAVLIEKSEATQRLFAKKKTMLLGLGNSLQSVPEEEGCETSGTPMDIYFEFIDQESLLANIRLGLNSSAEKDDDYKVNTISLYAAYRVIFDMLSSEDLKTFGFAGPAAMFSTLSGNADKSASSVGLLVGLGGRYRLFWQLRVGAQIAYFTNQQDFDVVKRFVGSTQAMLTMDYSF